MYAQKSSPLQTGATQTCCSLRGGAAELAFCDVVGVGSVARTIWQSLLACQVSFAGWPAFAGLVGWLGWLGWLVGLAGLVGLIQSQFALLAGLDGLVGLVG